MYNRIKTDLFSRHQLLRVQFLQPLTEVSGARCQTRHGHNNPLSQTDHVHDTITLYTLIEVTMLYLINIYEACCTSDGSRNTAGDD